MKIPMVDLPLGATEDRVCGTIDIEKALTEGKWGARWPLWPWCPLLYVALAAAGCTVGWGRWGEAVVSKGSADGCTVAGQWIVSRECNGKAFGACTVSSCYAAPTPAHSPPMYLCVCVS